ncbi:MULTISPECIES: ABC transporter permease [Ferroplasma]|jgi:ABC-2 type transport system permease protein|uniref:Multi drug ABC transporter permease protein n=2 Tax=Ferroplasma TaxID=74968 RepID=S0APW6_FERAC|nr:MULTISPECIES: ABC transporter permease subunit [Ferroplasma]MCL4349127.1 ABC transporter permease [Candidatus Thermoplasmatota archaeon]AGO60239.1 multi drug ABC transporter permease protein [Ferroplasma acidarmanus Fer1]ARD85051.1 ABC-2-type family permease [Ferroplasma acidiphilum]NOL60272.1 ABC transporter permease [Ferroplasma acidiphilum]WMT53991.1 MAG: ABC transporter permease subunit [Ferroplasma acidiphilum]
MSKTSTIYLQYIKNYYRSRSFFLMLFLILLIGSMMSYFSFKYVNDLPSFLGGTVFPASMKVNVFYYLWTLVLLYIPVFASVFFGSPAISSEIENKTAYFIFPLPINRYKLFFGKYFAAFTVTMFIVGIYLIFEVFTLSYLLGAIPATYFSYSFIMLVLFILSIMSVTFLISAIFNKNTYAYITVFVIYYIFFEAGSFIIELLYKYTPVYFLNDAASIIERVYININPGNAFVSHIDINPASFSEIMLSALIMVIYAVIALVIGMLLFDKKEVS